MASTPRYAEQLAEYTVVDTDVHLRIPREELVPYVEEPYARRVELGQIPKDSWDRYRSGRIDKRQVHRPEHIRRDLCEALNVDHPIINPSNPWLPRIPEAEYANALARAHNDYLIDAILDGEDDFFGLAQLATQDPALAAEEIDRVADERGIVGLYVIPMGTEVPLGDPRYNPIYEAAEDHGLTIAFHPHGTIAATRCRRRPRLCLSRCGPLVQLACRVVLRWHLDFRRRIGPGGRLFPRLAQHGNHLANTHRLALLRADLEQHARDRGRNLTVHLVCRNL